MCVGRVTLLQWWSRQANLSEAYRINLSQGRGYMLLIFPFQVSETASEGP